ncbi:hypothetical protein TVD_01040 [Thioalkalivibrio versutus]|uniref:Uncharacterized protein n=1 Tax=Thioalkalivibrio versutus TaxID=106634 RepID=A0A0G3FYJ1_9GAMM|nr:hypothetical protein [Thioalkalivibrio versutus]AKJ94038.1 hypothetical protein TVD_01040 [Thioalkalivibrio versutus]
MESSGEHRTWEDRVVDALRAPASWLFVLGLVLGAAAVHWGVERPPAEGALMVTVHNDSDVLIQAIHFDFGHDLSESSIREGQLRPGEHRRVALNHVPAAGFNMEIRYADGQVQEFCANRGVEGWEQEVRVYR